MCHGRPWDLIWAIRLCIMQYVCPRMQILEFHGLGIDHFGSAEEALANADKLIAHQRAVIQGVTKEHPDMIYPGSPLLDQFWYAKHNGTMLIYLLHSLVANVVAFTSNMQMHIRCVLSDVALMADASFLDEAWTSFTKKRLHPLTHAR